MSNMIHTMPAIFDADSLCGSDFQLIVRQNPECAKVAIGKEKDRKPVDPPPILQLRCTGGQSQHFLQSPYFFCSCALAPENENSPNPAPNSIVGNLVSSLHKLKDSDNSDGGFFVFGDLSVKQEGRFRLQFDLFELRDGDCIHRTSVRSNVFTVHSPKNFPGMSESTFLTRSFSDQGVRLRLRKDSRSLSSRKRASAAADISQMMPRKTINAVDRYYNNGYNAVKRRKFTQETGPTSHHSIPSTSYGTRSTSGPYGVDTGVGAAQNMMNSSITYAPQPPVLPRPNQSPVSYTHSPQSYGIPVQVTLAPEVSQPYSHASITAGEGSNSRGYSISQPETTQGYTHASIQTSDLNHTSSYQSIHTEDSTPSYHSHTHIATQLPSLEYLYSTPEGGQEGTLSRSGMGRLVSSNSMATTSSVDSLSGIASWPQVTHESQAQSHGVNSTPTPMSHPVSSAMAYPGLYARH